MREKIIKIILTGGGTGGSVIPLLAVAEEIKNYEFLWLGTKNGIEKEMVIRENIKFKAIINGKFRRYFSFENFIDIIKIKFAFWQSFCILLKHKPDLIMSAGSFVSVPVVWAGWILRIPVIIHQMDVRAGLANKLMAPFAKKITVTFKKSLRDYGKKAIWVGNPARSLIKEIKMSRREAIQKLGFNFKKPIVLIMGGGTGATAINKLVEDSKEKLTKFCQIIHITGRGKSVAINTDIKDYKNFEFLDTTALVKAYSASNVAITRCGIGALTDLSILKKPSILIPMPDSHQEDNAEIFNKENAAIVLDQNKLSSEKFIKTIKNLLSDQEKQAELSSNISKIIKTGARGEIVKIIDKLVE